MSRTESVAAATVQSSVPVPKRAAVPFQLSVPAPVPERAAVPVRSSVPTEVSASRSTGKTKRQAKRVLPISSG